MISKAIIYEKVKNILVNEFEVNEDLISLEANLFTDLDLDSLDAIDLMVTLDKELNIELKTEQMESLRTIQDVCDFIASTTNNE